MSCLYNTYNSSLLFYFFSLSRFSGDAPVSPYKFTIRSFFFSISAFNFPPFLLRNLPQQKTLRRLFRKAATTIFYLNARVHQKSANPSSGFTLSATRRYYYICIFVFCQRGIFIILFSLPFPQFSALSSAPCLWFCGKTPCLDSLYANTAYAQTDTGLG